MIQIPAFLLAPRVLAGLAIAAAAAGLVGYAWWWHSSEVREAVAAEGARWVAMIEKARGFQRAEVAAWVVEMTNRESAARSRYERLAAERREIFITLEKEIPIYVTPLADSRCVIPVGFVHHHDAAAAARAAPVPTPSGGSLDADSGVALSAVERTVAANYAACHDAIAEVRRWREWYAVLRAEWDRLLVALNPKENPQ